MESYGLSTPVAGGELKQLIARNTDVHSRPILLTDGADYLRGCLVFAATPDAQFVKVANGSLPASTDVIAIVAEDGLFSTITDDADGVEHVGYTHGEFIYDTVFRASSDDLTAADVLACVEACMKQGINLVKERYGKFVPAV